MSKRNNYFEEDADKNQPKVKKKKINHGKNFLIFIGIVAIALGAFVGTIKIVNPNYDFSQLIPAEIVEKVNPKAVFAFLDEKIMGVTTTTEPYTQTTETTTRVTTTMQMMDYFDSSEFALKTEVQGSQIGTLLNGGLVGTDMSFIYHYVEGVGIYRLVPSTEDFALYYGIRDKISCINLRGDYIYYVNNKNNTLCKAQKGKTEAKVIANDVDFAFVYDDKVYFTTTTGKICTMDVKALIPVTAYYAGEHDVKFVGVSLNRVFFTVTNPSDEVKYLTVDNFGHSRVAEFRPRSKAREIKKLQLENGFFYYYQLQEDETYNLCRQKYGSDKVVTLVKNVDPIDYVEVNANRLYYSTLKDGKYLVRELNMNTGDDKVMLGVTNVEDDNSLSFYLGGEYNFIIGEKSKNGVKSYCASSIYTSSTNAMKFNNGKWRY